MRQAHPDHLPVPADFCFNNSTPLPQRHDSYSLLTLKWGELLEGSRIATILHLYLLLLKHHKKTQSVQRFSEKTLEPADARWSDQLVSSERLKAGTPFVKTTDESSIASWKNDHQQLGARDLAKRITRRGAPYYRLHICSSRSARAVTRTNQKRIDNKSTALVACD